MYSQLESENHFIETSAAANGLQQEMHFLMVFPKKNPDYYITETSNMLHHIGILL